MFDVKAKIWFEFNSKCVVGNGRAELLRNIKNEESLSEAARIMGMSYSHAWSEIKEISDVVGDPVIETSRGGKNGGKSCLTPLGETILHLFEKEKMRLEEYIANKNRE